MDEKYAAVPKEILVELVKLAQKRQMKGREGGWKDFLSVHDKTLGVSASDPARRPADVLNSFLKTITQEEDLRLFDKVMECHRNRGFVEEFKNKSGDLETLEQKLVRTTLEHPQYPLNYCFPSHEEGWLVTKRRKNAKSMRSTDMIAVDCEMVLCEDGTEALVRVCAVDRNLEVKLNELVNPEKAVADYRSEITGVSAKDLEGVSCSLTYVQKSIKNLLRQGTILVGHSLNNDLKALKLDHARVIDTSFIFKHGAGSIFRRPALSALCKTVLGYQLREDGTPHNCLDDACAAMKLVLAKIEGGFDEAIPIVENIVPEVELSKLLIHRIPITLPLEELIKVVPGDFTIELKPNKKAGAVQYSAFAIFKNQQEATEAFESLDGNQESDSWGRPQKSISFKLSSGATCSFTVRKMATQEAAVKKRPLQCGEVTIESKKLKTDECESVDNYPKEIEKLKQEASLRDQEISNLNKIVAALTRKQGL